MQTLGALFKAGYIHGAISESSFVVNTKRGILLGKLEESLTETREKGKRVNDVLGVAEVVRAHVRLCEPLLIDILTDMTADAPGDRPLPGEVLQHPFFWSGPRRIALLCGLSDLLQSPQAHVRNLGPVFESRTHQVIGVDWTQKLDQSLLIDAGKFATYSGKVAADLIRLIRNKWMHKPHKENGERLEAIGSSADDYFAYFDTRFPNLFLYSYYFVEKYARELLEMSDSDVP
jgi:hypothetical protein